MSGLASVPAHDAETAARRATGAEIARRRKALKLTPAELAQAAGVAVTLVQRYELGNAVLIDMWQLRSLAEVLGVSAGQLVDAGRPVVEPPAVSPHDGRGPGRRSVFVVASVTDEAVGTGWRLIRYDPQILGTHWEPSGTNPGVNARVIQWASMKLGGAAFVAGPADAMTGGRSWYLGALGRTAPAAKPSRPSAAAATSTAAAPAPASTASTAAESIAAANPDPASADPASADPSSADPSGASTGAPDGG